MYTERYMDTPQGNPDGYERSDLMKQVEKLRGRRFLLAHGTDDDNVHFQHSMLLAKQLQHSDIDFEQMVCIVITLLYFYKYITYYFCIKNWEVYKKSNSKEIEGGNLYQISFAIEHE